MEDKVSSEVTMSMDLEEEAERRGLRKEFLPTDPTFLTRLIIKSPRLIH